MTPNSLVPVGVILPDGRIDTGAVHLITEDVELVPIEFPIVSGIPAIQDRYESMRLAGESHNIAEVLATRRFAAVRSDAVFNEGKFSGESGRIGLQELWRRRQAESAGVSTNGKWYCSGLASYPGDPTAWVDGRNDVLRIAKEKNLTVHGYVDHQGYEVDPGGDLLIADDIIEDEVQDILDSCPGVKAEDVRERVHALRTGQADPNPLRVTDHNFEE